MDRNEKQIEALLASAPAPAPPEGLLQRLEAAIELPERQQKSAFHRLLTGLGPVPSLRRMAILAGATLLILLPVAYSTGIIPDRLFNFLPQLMGPKITYRGFTSVKGWGSTDPNYKIKFEEFKTLFNAGKARKTAPGEYSAMLANGEEFRFNGDPNTLSFTKDEEEAWKRKVDEAISRKEQGIYEKVYYPHWMQETVGGIPSPSGRLIMERYVLSGGKIFTPGTGEATRKNEQAFAEIEKLRKEGKFVKVYRPIDSFLKDPGIIRYDVPRLGFGEKYRYCESTYLVSDGRLFIIGEYEPAQASEAAFQEIEKLRAAGQCKKTYRPQYDLMLKDGLCHYVEAAYTLANGQEFMRVEYEKVN